MDSRQANQQAGAANQPAVDASRQPTPQPSGNRPNIAPANLLPELQAWGARQPGDFQGDPNAWGTEVPMLMRAAHDEIVRLRNEVGTLTGTASPIVSGAPPSVLGETRPPPV